jgi:hypothetical protein
MNSEYWIGIHYSFHKENNHFVSSAGFKKKKKKKNLIIVKFDYFEAFD